MAAMAVDESLDRHGWLLSERLRHRPTFLRGGKADLGEPQTRIDAPPHDQAQRRAL